MRAMSIPTKLKQPMLRDGSDLVLPRNEDDAQYQSILAVIAAIDKRHAEAVKREKAAERGLRPTRDPLARADDLIAGGRIISADPAAEVQAAQHEQYLLRNKRMKQVELLVARAGELDYAICKQCAPLVDEALRAADTFAEWLFEALEVARTVRGRIQAGGHQINSSAISVEEFPEGARLGSSMRGRQTPAAFFRQRLIDAGVISK